MIQSFTRVLERDLLLTKQRRPMPTVAEFIKIVCRDHGAQLSEFLGQVLDESGSPLPMRRLVRRLATGEIKFAIVPETVGDGDQMAPSVVRAMCRQLAIAPEVFGLGAHLPN